MYRSLKNEPAVDTTSRESLIQWLMWNDPNGCYSDHDSLVEFGEIAPYEDLLYIYQDMQRNI